MLSSPTQLVPISSSTPFLLIVTIISLLIIQDFCEVFPFSTLSYTRLPPSISSQPSSIYSILVYMVYMYIRTYISMYYLAYRNVSCPHPPPPSYMYQCSLFPLNSGLSPHFCMFWALPFVIEPFLRCLVILGCLLALNCRRRDILSVT